MAAAAVVLLAAANRLLVFCELANLCAKFAPITGRAPLIVFFPQWVMIMYARAPPERAKKRPGLRRAPGENCLMLRRSDAMGAKQ